MRVEVETTIKGGLKVIVSGDVFKGHPREYPGRDHIDDMEILWASGHEIKFEISEHDWDAAADALFTEARRGEGE